MEILETNKRNKQTDRNDFSNELFKIIKNWS